MLGSFTCAVFRISVLWEVGAVEVVSKPTVLVSDALSGMFFSGKSTRGILYLGLSGRTGTADSLPGSVT